MRPSNPDTYRDHGNGATSDARRKRAREKGHDFEPVADIAEKYADGLPVAASQRDLEAVKKIWRDISGDFISSNTSVASLKDGILTVTARATPFLFHLRSAKNNYISQINERLRAGAVREIFYRIGAVKTSENAESAMFDDIRAAAKRDEIASYSVENIEVPADVEASINDFVASLAISDAELREKMTSAAKTIYRVTQYKKRNGYVECAVCSSLYYRKAPHEAESGIGADSVKDDTCEYCRFRMSKLMAGAAKRIAEYPWESYEAHIVKFPDTKFREFEYMRRGEFEKARDEVEALVKKYVMSEAAEDFARLDLKIRFAMSLHETFNYFEVKEFGAARLDRMAAVLGPNTRAVFTRGSMVARF